jgi:flagellar basal-body rod protein FlgB
MKVEIKMNIGNDAVVNKLVADLDIKVLRSKLIASNIANVDTPKYKAKDLMFHRIMEENMENGGMKLKQTHVKHMTSEMTGSAGSSSNEIVESPNPGRPDGNNVNIDEEMLKLTENNIQYNVSVQLLSKRLRQIYDAIDRSK